jgi:hypothetical protein
MVAGMVEMGGANTKTGRIHNAEWKDSHTTLLCSNNEATAILTTSREIIINETIKGAYNSSTEVGVLADPSLVILVGAEGTTVHSARLSDILLI